MDKHTFEKGSAKDLDTVKQLMLEAVEESQNAFSFTKEEMLSNTEIWWNFYLQPYFDPNKGGIMLVKKSQTLVAMCGWQFNTRVKQKHIAYIYWLYVSKQARAQGVGRKLIESVLEEIVKKKEIKKIFLSVTSTQSSAIKIYESLGFEKVGENKMELYSDDNFLDVCLYEKYI